jgi:hypothetical protein
MLVTILFAEVFAFVFGQYPCCLLFTSTRINAGPAIQKSLLPSNCHPLLSEVIAPGMLRIHVLLVSDQASADSSQQRNMFIA